MATSEAINEISTALAKAQGEIANPAKESQNPHFKSHYADLSSGINAIRTALSANGIAFTQLTRLSGDVLMVDTRLSHSSGQWIESEFPACRFPAKPQEVGSALTYARRYALFAIIGIAGEDDDGEAANKSETPAPARRAPPPPPRPVVDTSLEASQAARDAMLEDLSAITTDVELSDWFAKAKPAIDKLHEADKQAVRDAYADTKQALKGKAAA